MSDTEHWSDEVVEIIKAFDPDIQKAAHEAYAGLAGDSDFADNHVSETTIAFARAIAAERARCAEITPAMIQAGIDAVLSEVGGADLGGYFSARDLALKVYRAMASLRLSMR